DGAAVENVNSPAATEEAAPEVETASDVDHGRGIGELDAVVLVAITRDNEHVGAGERGDAGEGGDGDRIPGGGRIAEDDDAVAFNASAVGEVLRTHAQVRAVVRVECARADAAGEIDRVVGGRHQAVVVEQEGCAVHLGVEHDAAGEIVVEGPPERG